MKAHIVVLYILLSVLLGWSFNRQQSLEISLKYKGFQIDSLCEKTSKQEQWLGKLLEVSKVIDAAERSNSTSIESMGARLLKLENKADLEDLKKLPKPDLSEFRAPPPSPVFDSTANKLDDIEQRVNDLESEQTLQELEKYEAKLRAERQNLMRDLLKK